MAQLRPWHSCFALALALAVPLGCSEGSGAPPGGGEPVGTGQTGGESTSGGAPSLEGSGGLGGGDPSSGGSTPSGGSAASAGGASSASTGGQGTGGGPSVVNDVLAELRSWLAYPPASRPPLETQDFSQEPLSLAQVETARELLWGDLAEQIRTSRGTEVDQKSITVEGSTLIYETVLLGDAPAGGRSLFLSMHGGGNASKEVNDEQWNNQVALAQSYSPEDAIWVAPRAPIDDWNMWFTSDIPPLFDRLISNMIVFEGVDPNKIYLTGYSAGGDGVYQLGPTMADRWAGAAMSAGHPNDMTPTNLRNLPFAIHVGGDDTAYDRNLVAAEWGSLLDDLQANDPNGYPHQVQVHAGLPHWMDLADQPSVPFIQSFARNVYPDRVVWKQSTLLETRFYWLRIQTDQAVKDAQVTASIDNQTITLQGADYASITLLLDDALLDLDQSLTVRWDGSTVYDGVAPRTVLDLHNSLAEREDPSATFSAALTVQR